MKSCTVCHHTFEKGVNCPRCGTDKTYHKLKFDWLKVEQEVKVLHECFELDEMLCLDAFKTKSGWAVNVETWVDGKNQYAVVSVPVDKFRELIRKIDEYEQTNKGVI